MSRRYHLTSTALADLDAIWLYIAGSSLDRADQFLDKLERIMQMLADYPKIRS